MLARNSASSRAMPDTFFQDKVAKEPFDPIKWMKKHPGMQGTEFFDEGQSRILEDVWNEMRLQALENAAYFTEAKVTKQISNRLLEPFAYHRIVTSATEWDNFTALRAHEAAEIHIQDLAYKWLNAMNASTPVPRAEGEWHLPFIPQDDAFEWSKLSKRLGESYSIEEWPGILLKMSTGKCAWTSYDYFDGDRSPEKAVDTHDKLILSTPIHASPAEHPARCMNDEEYHAYSRVVLVQKSEMDEYRANNPSDWYRILGRMSGTEDYMVKEFGWCGKFRGWIQYRKLLPRENAIDKRLKKHYKV